MMIQFGFWWWEAPEDCQIDDRKAWRFQIRTWRKVCLTLMISLLQLNRLREMGMSRWRLNQWVRSQESWLPVGAWEQCVSDLKFDPDLPVWVGIDMALKHDTIAVCSCTAASRSCCCEVKDLAAIS
jgi:phage terminase large subunit-like protein